MCLCVRFVQVEASQSHVRTPEYPLDSGAVAIHPRTPLIAETLSKIAAVSADPLSPNRRIAAEDHTTTTPPAPPPPCPCVPLSWWPRARAGPAYRNGTVTRNDVLKTRDKLGDSCTVLDRCPDRHDVKTLMQDGVTPVEVP